MTYRVDHYGADGCNGPADDFNLATGLKSLSEARQVARKALGLQRLPASRMWLPPDEMGAGEAYHDYPASHPQADGCGGVAITDEADYTRATSR